jgi:ribosomal protein S18 acetylase RimI-like enzyme
MNSAVNHRLDGLLVPDAFAGGHLGRRVYRLIDPARAAEALQQVAGGGEPVLIEAKIPVADVRTVALLTSLGFRVIDTGVQLDALPAALVARAKRESWTRGVRAATPADRAAVERVAGDNLVTSRFHLDPQIEPARASGLKRAWVGNFFEGRRGDRLFVAESDRGVAGFLLVLEQDGEGVIDLIALDPILRGTGAAGALILAWMECAPALTRVVVGTQVSNVQSLRAYDKLGFRVCGASYVLHHHRA